MVGSLSGACILPVTLHAAGMRCVCYMLAILRLSIVSMIHAFIFQKLKPINKLTFYLKSLRVDIPY